MQTRSRLFKQVLVQKRNKYMITTPIFYVNGKPHIGHLYSCLLADSMARWQKQIHKNVPVLFSTGTDEHGIKVQKSAAPNDTLSFCDQVSACFKQMSAQYNIQYDDFIRTTEPRHKEFVTQFWNLLHQRGDIYKGEYKGWYCASDEAFVTEVNKIPETGQVVSAESGQPCEWLVEHNYKFKLSKYQQAIIEWLEKHPQVIQPKERYNEVMSFLKREPLEDLSVSRASDRVKWGIPVPSDPSQTIYVWLDALTNYLTVCQNKPNLWPADVHIIGKDILKFHAIYWPAFLLAANMPLPMQLIVHSHWTVNHIKMSKSRGNVQCPTELMQKYINPEYIRYYLLSEARIADDSNFSHDELPLRVNQLADMMGNLLSRTFGAKLRQAEYGQAVHLFNVSQADKDVIQELNGLKTIVNDAYVQADFKTGILQIIQVLKRANQWYDEQQPWRIASLHKQSPSNETAERLQTIKYLVVETLRICGICLYPVMPQKMDMLLQQWMGLDFADYAFAKLEFGAQWGTKITTIKLQQAPPILFEKLK